MRKWFKYSYDTSIKGIKRPGIDDTFESHAERMGSYDADEYYKTKDAFFKKYFFGYHLGRLEHYDKFLRKHLSRDADILSIGSGRCANELALMEDSYKITCSDLELINAYPETKKLFPMLDYIKLDVLKNPASKRYDAIIALSIIYLFDKKNLKLFFKNVSESLKPGGQLIIDSAGSSDNLLSFLINDVYLKCEVQLMRFLKFLLTGKHPGLVVKEFGFRRTDAEIIESAKMCGFELAGKENHAFLTDFRRSYVFNKLVPQGSFLERYFEIIGKRVPYVRIYNFKKVG